MNERIWFIDTVSPYEYDSETLKTNPQGGTETTVTRIAEALAGQGMRVTVAQAERSLTFPGKVTYCSLDSLAEYDAPNYIVALRDPTFLMLAKQRWPNAHRLLWLHDITTPQFFIYGKVLEETKPTIITVSRFHLSQTYETLKILDDMIYDCKLKTIYNPVVEGRSSIGYDETKLLWLSSPHKGLDHALDMFSHVKRAFPDMRLYVANPGYVRGKKMEQEGVVDLGNLSHSEATKHLQSSLALFYPNIVFPETFGLVMAEAEAWGCPVLTHPMGASPEILQDKSGLIDCRNYVIIVETIRKWRDGSRPVVNANPKFNIEEVTKTWIYLMMQISSSRSKSVI